MKADVSELSASTMTVSTAATATLRDYVDLLRPRDWVKNVIVLAGPAAALKLSQWESCVGAGWAFVAFCLAASAIYAFNDVLDRHVDALHPTKSQRPIARGAITPAAGMSLSVILALASLTITVVTLNRAVTIVVTLYLALTVAYTLALKQRVILDVILIAVGFVLRAWAGSLAVGVPASEWLVACVFTLCLFMGFGKRRCEVTMLGNSDDAGAHRSTLVRYTPQLLTHLITVSAGIAVITFLLYTLDTSGHPTPFQKQHLFYTLPIVVYGVFRFAMLTELGRYSGPTDIVLRDRAMLTAIVLWLGAALLIAYQVPLLGEGGLEQWIGSAARVP